MPSSGAEIILIDGLYFLMRCYGPANYGIFVAALTALIVFLIGVTGVAPGPVMVARGVNTLAGGAIALLAYALWPTWERDSCPSGWPIYSTPTAPISTRCATHMSRSGPDAPLRLDRARLAARLARSNAEASLTRLLSEPGVSEERADGPPPPPQRCANCWPIPTVSC